MKQNTVLFVLFLFLLCSCQDKRKDHSYSANRPLEDPTKLGFDAYQSYSSGKFTTEGQTTQRAERIGWNNGWAAHQINIIRSYGRKK